MTRRPSSRSTTKPSTSHCLNTRGGIHVHLPGWAHLGPLCGAQEWGSPDPTLPEVHFVDTHGPPGDSALRSCQYSFGFRNQIQTNFTKNKKELMISWEVRKSPKVEPPSDMTEPSLLAFPGMDLTLTSTLGALRKLCIGLPSSLQLIPCCLDS